MAFGRRRYVVAYDIRDDWRLRRVHDVVKSYGYPLQYSVFVFDLDRSELIGLRWDLRDVMRLGADSVVLIDLGEPDGRGAECFEFMGVRPGLPSGGAQIV